MIAFEEDILVKQTIKVAIEQMYALGRAESDAFECLLVAGDNPCGSSTELVFECGTHILIEAQHILILRESLAIWRVDHNEGILCCSFGEV